MAKTVMLALALWAGAALAHQHQWVAGDALEVGARYYLEKMETRFLNVPRALSARSAALRRSRQHRCAPFMRTFS